MSLLDDYRPLKVRLRYAALPARGAARKVFQPADPRSGAAGGKSSGPHRARVRRLGSRGCRFRRVSRPPLWSVLAAGAREPAAAPVPPIWRIVWRRPGLHASSSGTDQCPRRARRLRFLPAGAFTELRQPRARHGLHVSRFGARACPRRLAARWRHRLRVRSVGVSASGRAGGSRARMGTLRFLPPLASATLGKLRTRRGTLRAPRVRSADLARPGLPCRFQHPGRRRRVVVFGAHGPGGRRSKTGEPDRLLPGRASARIRASGVVRRNTRWGDGPHDHLPFPARSCPGDLLRPG